MCARTSKSIPGVGLRGFDGIKRLAEAYRWAVDIEICVFPQEGLTNNPGTEELMREALAQGAQGRRRGAVHRPDPHGQIDRVFRMARDFDVDIDMHLDLGDSPELMDVEYVCEMTERYRYGGRVSHRPRHQDVARPARALRADRRSGWPTPAWR